MDFSVQLFNDNVSWKTLEDIARTVDRGSWRTLWNYDHLVPPMAEILPHLTDDLRAYEEKDVFEAWSMLAAWGPITKRVRLGCLVTAIPFRNPALLAKMAVTVDHISNGRLELGLGAAWHVGETRAYGIELGPNKDKLDRFGEALEVLRQLLTPGTARRNFQGRFFTLDDAPFAPAPLQKHLPILIGGGGEKRTLRYVAEFADSYNYFASFLSTPEEYNKKNRVLDEHCAAIGRDPKEIRRTVAIFADIIEDESAAKKKRDFLGKHLEEDARRDLLYGSPRFIVDGVGRALDQIKVDEIIFCGLSPNAEAYQRFEEEVLQALKPMAVLAR